MSLISCAVGSAQETYGLKYRVVTGKENGGGQGWTHEHTFKAYHKAVGGTLPLCIGVARDGQNTNHKGQRYLVKWGLNAAGNGWTHDRVIHVFGTPEPGTQPFSVSHAEPVWRYRILPGEAGGPTFLIVAGDHVLAESFDNIEKAKAKLMAVTTRSRLIAEVDSSGTLKRDPHEVGGQNQGGGSAAGFNKYWNDWHDINRMMDVAQRFLDGNKGANGCGSGWTHDFTFWAYKTGPVPSNPSAQPETLVVAVGRAQENYGSKFCLIKDKEVHPTWNKVFKFRAWTKNQPGRAPVSVYHDPNGWRYKVVQEQKRMGRADGFVHSFTFFPQNFQTPGTVPNTVSHADNPTRYRVNEGTSSANEPGWTQDFIFYALPAI